MLAVVGFLAMASCSHTAFVAGTPTGLRPVPTVTKLSSEGLCRRPPSQVAMTVLVVNGKKINAAAGSNLGRAVEKGGLRPYVLWHEVAALCALSLTPLARGFARRKYNCKKGECGSCTISVGGTRMKACIGKVPPEPALKSLKEKGLVVR